jgi:anti-sigma-K factor RskA
MTCEHRRDLMPLYVADALDEADRLTLRHHLAGGCAACAGSLAEARATFAAVSLGLDPVEPSPDLLRRLMGRIDATPVRAATAPPRRWAWRVLSPVLAAAVAAAVTIAVLAVRRPARESQLIRDADGRTALLRSAVEARDQTVEQLREQLGRQQLLVDALRSPTATVVRLDGSAQPRATGRLVWDPAAGRSVLLAAGLAAPPPGRTYELWYITTDNRKVRAVTFDPASGAATVAATVPPGLAPLAAAAVTDEPAGGVDSPTGSLQLLGKQP